MILERKGPDIRDYPKNFRGDVDEWGAILKHREEVCISQVQTILCNYILQISKTLENKMRLAEFKKKAQYNEDLMQTAGLKEKHKQILQRIKEEERRIADMNVSRMEQLEKQAKYKQNQMKLALAREYEQTIKEKKARQLQDIENSAAMDRSQKYWSSTSKLRGLWHAYFMLCS